MTAETKTSAAWLYGPATDLLVGCGVWSLPLLLLAYAGAERASGCMAVAFYVLAIFCNNPHYMATVYRAYRTPQETTKYRLFTVWVSALLLLMVAVLVWKPRLLPFAFTAYILWSPWHYTGQNFGIAMMMARRNGIQPSRLDRQLVYLFFAASYVLWAVDFNEAGWDDPRILSLGIPRSLALPVQTALITTSLASGGWGIHRLIRQSGARAMLAPVALMVTQFLWFLMPVMIRMSVRLEVSPLFYSTGMLAFMHCAQYLWVTSYFARRETENSAARSWSFARYFLILVMGGIALFIPGPWLISLLFRRDLVESLFIFIALVNLHHFILDGVIWKLRDNKIARLLLGARSLRSEPPEEAMAPARWVNWLIGPACPARILRWGIVGTLVAVGAVDQLQYVFTEDKTTLPRLHAAEMVNRNDTRVYFQRARILRDRGEIDAALAELDRAIALNPYNLAPQSLKGELLSRQGRTGAAFEQFDRMSSLFKPMPMILINAGVFAVQSGHPEKAVANYEKALELNPEDLRLHLALGEACQLAGKLAQASREYSIYISAAYRNGSRPDAQLILAEMKLAECCLAMKLPDKAVWWYRAAARQAQQAGETNFASQSLDRLRRLLPASPATATATNQTPIRVRPAR